MVRFPPFDPHGIGHTRRTVTYSAVSRLPEKAQQHAASAASIVYPILPSYA